ncbi:hypothetical protein CGK42_24020, partial [Vibrio parahaemolyticus]|uniref:hypothetical protein n=1 Tax=Vibrio parahaemolyticus TaxID=670 RepID=UPI001166C9B3
TYLSKLYGHSPVDLLKEKMISNGNFRSKIKDYVKIENKNSLINIADILSEISDFDSEDYTVGERLFGKVHKIFENFNQMQVSIGRDKFITITNRIGLDLWSARDSNEGVEVGDTVAVCTRRGGDDVGTRCGPEFVTGVLDIFFPLLENDNDRKVDVYLGASNSMALIVARTHEKSRILAGGGELSKDLARILGVKRLLVTNSGFLSREEALFDSDAMTSFVRNFINDFYSVCIIDRIDHEEKLIEFRVPQLELEKVNVGRVRSLFGITEKVFLGIDIHVYFGADINNRREITREYASGFREHSYYGNYG